MLGSAYEKGWKDSIREREDGKNKAFKVTNTNTGCSMQLASTFCSYTYKEIVPDIEGEVFPETLEEEQKGNTYFLLILKKDHTQQSQTLHCHFV